MMEEAKRENVGKRIQMHAATDAWMSGDRFGEIIGIGRARAYTHEAELVRPYRVKLDKSGRTVRVHPCNLFLAD